MERFQITYKKPFGWDEWKYIKEVIEAGSIEESISIFNDSHYLEGTTIICVVSENYLLERGF